MTRPLLRRPPRHAHAVILAVSCLLPPAVATAADPPPGLANAGVALAPADASFLFSTLRAREQWDRFAGSKAFAALRGIPAVKRALDSLDEQRTTPGTVPALVTATLELPENTQAANLLADMVATDTFVYGEPSCTAFVQLLQKLAAAAQAAIEIGDDGVFLDEEEMFEKDEEFEDGDEAAMRRSVRRMRCQFEFGAEVDEISAEARRTRMLVQTLVDNPELLVVPDVVWGFRTTMPDAARAQLARLEALAQSAVAGNPELADGVARKRIADGDFLVLTLRGEWLPWGEIEAGIAEHAGDIEGFDEVLMRLRELDLCIAVGVVGDRVILSIGDSTDHVEKFPAGAKTGLLSLPALAPLAAHADERLTTVWYVSTELAKALAQSPDAVQRNFEPVAASFREAGLSPEAAAECRAVIERFAEAVATRMPEPGGLTAFSFLTDTGYEGYAWDWSKKQPLDGGRRLDLLEHAGGAPLAVAVSRFRGDPALVEEVVALVGGLWAVSKEETVQSLDDAERKQAEAWADRFETLTRRMAEVVRGKLLAAVADGQVALVFDAKSRTRKPQRDLPASAEALPLPEPAIVLPLKDAKLFSDGLNELLAVGDEAIEAFRELEADALPPDFCMPEPEKSKVEAGTVWSFPVPDAGLDEQFRPAIGVGDDVAVFSLAPKQAARLLGSARLETGSQLSTFEDPLAGAAVADVAGLVDALEPWIVYLTRYGCVREREGAVEADDELVAADETAEAREALAAVDTVLEVAKCLRAAVAETAIRDGTVVTHWRNIIRDLPKKP